MQTHRFFAKPDTGGDFAVLDTTDSQHAIRVLRLKKGDSVLVSDGNGFDYDGVITDDNVKEVRLAISNKRPNETESRYRITLLQGLPKSGKMDLIIQKCVEIGVDRIIPINAMRSVVKADKSQFSKKLERYNRISLEAAKQSHRGVIPEVTDIADFDSLDYSKYDLVLVAYEEEKDMSVKRLIQSVIRTTPDLTDIAIVIGPEGGLDASEIEYLKAHNAKTCTLGNRILRTETAGLVTAAIVLSELEG